MKIAQYVHSSSNKVQNKSFQKEFWDQLWSERSFDSLVSQLKHNPLYWRLKKSLAKEDFVLEAGEAREK